MCVCLFFIYKIIRDKLKILRNNIGKKKCILQSTSSKYSIVGNKKQQKKVKVDQPQPRACKLTAKPLRLPLKLCTV